MTSRNSGLGRHRAIMAGAVVVIFAGCASGPVPPSTVVSMTTMQGARAEGIPPRNTVWRLDEHELKALGPIQPAPDPLPVPVQVVSEPVYPVSILPSIGYYDSGWSFGLGIGFGHAYRPYWPRYRPYRYYHR
jgi:hypothetical protein